MKIDVEYLEFMWPMRHFLITCGAIGERPDIVAVSFCMPVSKEPPMLACAIATGAHSCALIETHGEFVVNVPPEELKKQVYYCGSHTGAQVDKFEGSGLTPVPARSVAAPVVDECVAHMECLVRQAVPTGDKKLFIAEVIEAYAEEYLARGDRKIAFALGDFPRHIYGARFGKK
ncbi:MAG: flavin reductase family protein [Candidatus Krumholzibacteria bacterium]|nr:flavin reductase family protein [Candidatus Krumholzibacteria bacterium]